MANKLLQHVRFHSWFMRSEKGRGEGRRGASVNYISRGCHSIELLVIGNGFLRHLSGKSVVVVVEKATFRLESHCTTCNNFKY